MIVYKLNIVKANYKDVGILDALIAINMVLRYAFTMLP